MNKYLTLIILLFVSSSLFSQKKEILTDVSAKATKAIYLGKTPRIIEKGLGFNSKRTNYKKQKQLPPNFIGRGKSKVTRPELEHQGSDPLRQMQNGGRVASSSVTPLANFDGLSNSFGSPHDPSGAIGLNYYMQAINATVIGIFEKDGTLVTSFAGNALWSPLGEASRGDPVIVYDHENERWIITEFANPANLLIAVSETNDPLGSYFVYSFSTPNFPDYPKWAIWGSYLVVTTNEVGPGFLHQYFFDRDGLIAGNEDVTMQRVEINGNTSTEAGFYVTTPVHWNGTLVPQDDKPMALKINDSSWGEVTEDIVEVFTFDIDLDDPSNTQVTKTSIVTTPFDSYPCDSETGGFACLSQGGATNGIDAIPEVIMNIPHYWNFGTHESMVFNFITDVTSGNNLSGIRWMELRRFPGNDWTLYQEGTYAPDDGLHRFMGSIAMDKDGNMGLAYNVSGPSESAGIRFTGRMAEDPLGEMTFSEQVVIDGINGINTDRFGDYPHMTLDQFDGRTFWYTAEYGGNGSNNSKTRIFSYQIEKNMTDVEVTAISDPETSTDLTNAEAVTVAFTNNGIDVASDFDLQLILDGNLVETFTIAGPLASGATDNHTFATTIDLSIFGSYEVSAKVMLTGDEVEANNERSVTVKKLALIDGALEFDPISSTCQLNFSEDITLSNEGGNVITSATLDVFVNDVFQETFNWTGSIATNESETISILFKNLAVGDNKIVVSLETLNGLTDEVAMNNEIKSNVNFDSSQTQIVFNLLTDDYPGETTWEIRSKLTNDLVASGGPYAQGSTNYTEEICVPKDGCYNFTLFDSEEDGICCGFGQGSYSLIGEEGETIFTGGEFGAFETTEVCVGFICGLNVFLNKVDASRDILGSIELIASNGIDYQYSIDGGTTFGTIPIFENLASGTYDIVVTSDGGLCTFETTVVIDYILALDDELIQGLQLSPNPTSDLFKISLEGHPYIKGFLNVQVLDIQGRVIQERRLSRYNQIFEGQFSLYAYPSGIYFLKFPELESHKIVKVIKD